MVKTIFLDVGSWQGCTLEEVIKNIYSFDEIHSFEPCKANYHILCNKYKNYNNIFLHNIGLSNENKECDLFSSGEMGASVYYDKVDLVDKSNKEKIILKNSSEWIKNNLNLSDKIIMKLNCEGSECDIVENLIFNNIFDNINHIMIDFDVRKIPSQKHRESYIKNLIKNKNNIETENEVMIGDTHQDRIANWLKPYFT